MTLHQLTVLREVAFCGSFTQAAAQLMISRSAISVLIKALENELGVHIFERNPKARKLELTPAGRLVLKSATQVLDILDDLQKDVHNLRGIPTSAYPIRVACGSSMSMYLFERIVAELRARFPNVDVPQWVEASPQNVAAGFREGMYDMAILPRDIALPGPYQYFIMKQRLTMVARTSELPLQQNFLWDHPYLALPPRDTYVRRLIDRYFLERGVLPRVFFEARHPEAIKAAVWKLNLVAVTHRISVAKEIENGAFAEPAINLPVATYQILVHHNSRASDKTLEVIDFLTNQILATQM